MPLCPPCKRVLSNNLLANISKEFCEIHHETFQSFTDAIRSQCALCSSLLVRCIREGHLTPPYLRKILMGLSTTPDAMEAVRELRENHTQKPPISSPDGSCQQPVVSETVGEVEWIMVNCMSGIIRVHRRSYGRGCFTQDITFRVVVVLLNSNTHEQKKDRFEHTIKISGQDIQSSTESISLESIKGNVAEQIGPNQSKEALWKNIRFCADECDGGHHRRCPRVDILQNDNMFVPSRLVEISTNDWDVDSPDHKLHARLVTRAEVLAKDALPRYVALSHRWGTQQLAKLTTDNIGDYYTEIPLTSVSKTFQDSFLVTRKLGISYIWIDSLCIIQEGDAEDWKREAITMCDVYTHAYCTIAGHWTDENHGLLDTRDPTWLTTETEALDLKRFDSESVERCLISINHRFNHTAKSLVISPLSKRGWVLQEQVLSRRILHFTMKEVIWECASGFFREPMLGSDFQSVRELSTFSIDLVDDITHALKEDFVYHRRDTTNFLKRWYQLVEAYSTRNLTKATDRLHAIAGMVQKIAMYMPNENIYILGHWKDELLLSLTWQVLTNKHTYETWSRTVPNVPSFSWASISPGSDIHFALHHHLRVGYEEMEPVVGPIHFVWGHENSESKSGEVNETLLTWDSAQRVKLRVTGQLCPIRFVFDTSVEKCTLHISEERALLYLGKSDLASLISPGPDQKQLLYSLERFGSDPFVFCSIKFDFDPEQDGKFNDDFTKQPFYYVPLAHSPQELWLLLLIPVDIGQRTFRRAGVVLADQTTHRDQTEPDTPSTITRMSEIGRNNVLTGIPPFIEIEQQKLHNAREVSKGKTTPKDLEGLDFQGGIRSIANLGKSSTGIYLPGGNYDPTTGNQEFFIV
ncbi:heterokaryon incompatibility protein-domain-containing protein [Durotheca rogersii]|uniref:heterokaryon incompatibility protein-domain-containing protein n=1 Tax=Durotheca rogersii TaxID=419775 RepID=UPI0022211D98|nr:heterokaryon incompatibility protein-domain-containing protein [Durotheca rogersii]KAI5867100.1 heterokaryon incompatibility protein-domain-containing protein [Durotheca rogersii]